MISVDSKIKREVYRYRTLGAIVIAVAVLGGGSLAVAQAGNAAPADAGGSKATNSANDQHKAALQYERAMALNAVQNLIGRYGFYHLANMFGDERYLALYANGDPGLKIQVSSRGIWEGPDAAKRMLQS